MIKKIVLLSLIMLGFSCKKENEGYKIVASVDASLNNNKAEIYRFEKKNKKVFDSATVANGKLSFEGIANSPDTYFISIDGVKGFLPFILENADMDITMYKDSLDKSLIKGSKENEITKLYQKSYLEFGNRNTRLLARYRAAQAGNETMEMEAVKSEFELLIKDAKAFDIEFVKTHKESVFAAITLERISKAKTIDKVEAKTLYNSFPENIKQTRAAKETLEFLETPGFAPKASVNIGDIAPNFSGFTPEDKAFSLTENKAKLTILDFWASWCGPCRKENPNVVKLYDKYHSKGLEIIGVSLDKKGQKNRWLKAIEKDQLTWKHVSNLQGWQEPIAQQYGVRSIPATFILDESGKIIAKNLRGKALEEKIAELLN